MTFALAAVTGVVAYFVGYWFGFRLAFTHCRFCLLKHDACECIVITGADEDD